MNKIKDIIISQKAENYLNKIIENKKAIGILLEIVNSGCSGKSYNMDFIFKKNSSKEYLVLNYEKIKVMIKKIDCIYFYGLKIDLKNEKFGNKIIFINENIHGQCGCGESFNIIKKN